MDLQMPVMGGFDTTLEVRTFGIKNPIIAVTAAVQQKYIDKCKEVEIEDYLVKSVPPQSIVNKIKAFRKPINS